MQIGAYLSNKAGTGRLARVVLLPTVLAAATLAFFVAPAGSQEVRSSRASMAYSQNRPPKLLKGHVTLPSSNVIAKEDIGKKLHTNLRLFIPDAGLPSISYPPYSGYAYETPESVACVYDIVTPLAGCNPNTAVNVPAGGSQTIAIVDAYHAPTVAGDLAYFSDQMGLPFIPSKFQIVFASGFEPPVDYSGGWELEEALDVEWAHAMAPNATLYLVEANSNYTSDLITAVQVATNLVRCGKTTTCPTSPVPTGKGEVSMSWGGSEFTGENGYDTYFNQTNVVFLAAAGDGAGPIYPAASPNVISVGGTSIARSLSTGNFSLETAWQDAGGGPSVIETKPTYQSSLSGTRRWTPDVAAVADAETGVWVYNSFPFDGYYYASDWWTVGGTSVATPIWAGILNAASTHNGAFAASSSAELTKLYTDMASTSYASEFRDITYGNCYFYRGYFAGAKYDACTGIGAPYGFAGK